MRHVRHYSRARDDNVRRYDKMVSTIDLWLLFGVVVVVVVCIVSTYHNVGYLYEALLL